MNCMSMNVRGEGHLDKIRWVRRLRSAHGVHFVAILETQMMGSSKIQFHSFSGKSWFQVDFVNAISRSGGLVSN